uniref:Reverse transcriptase/retrotransposon-derived protein RNase H-like domain-containing protein n=1 Tax=Populus trichocarpa TaxID=3694 RepID=A0A2K2C3V5_POPTR
MLQKTYLDKLLKDFNKPEHLPFNPSNHSILPSTSTNTYDLTKILNKKKSKTTVTIPELHSKIKTLKSELQTLKQAQQKDFAILQHLLPKIESQSDTESEPDDQNVESHILPHALTNIEHIPDNFLNVLTQISSKKYLIKITLVFSDDFKLDIIALFDIGVDLNCIKECVVPKRFFQNTSEKLSTANNLKLHIACKTQASVFNKSISLKTFFVVTKDINHTIILAFYVNKNSEIERGTPRLVINYKPLNSALKWISGNCSKPKTYSSQKPPYKRSSYRYRKQFHSKPKQTYYKKPYKKFTKNHKPFQSKPKPKFDLKNITCYKCNQKGHTSHFSKINTKLYELQIDEETINQIQNLYIEATNTDPSLSDNSEEEFQIDEITTSSAISDTSTNSKQINVLIQDQEFILEAIKRLDDSHLQKTYLDKLLKWQITDKNQLQRFLGSLNYVLDCYPNISHLAKPLYDRLKTNPIPWSDLHTNLIKKQVQTIPLLHLANPLAPEIIETDASDLGYGGILKQVQDNKEQD